MSEQCGRMSKQMSKWPSSLRVYFYIIQLTVRFQMRRRISIRGYVPPSVGPSVPRYFQTRTRRILCRVSGLVVTNFYSATRRLKRAESGENELQVLLSIASTTAMLRTKALVTFSFPFCLFFFYFELHVVVLFFSSFFFFFASFFSVTQNERKTIFFLFDSLFTFFGSGKVEQPSTK